MAWRSMMPKPDLDEVEQGGRGRGEVDVDPDPALLCRTPVWCAARGANPRPHYEQAPVLTLDVGHAEQLQPNTPSCGTHPRISV